MSENNPNQQNESFLGRLLRRSTNQNSTPALPQLQNIEEEEQRNYVTYRRNRRTSNQNSTPAIPHLQCTDEEPEGEENSAYLRRRNSQVIEETFTRTPNHI